MNMNRQVLNSMEHGLHGQELRLSPLPFTLSQHSPSLNQLQSGGNITLGAGNNMGSATYGLPNNVYSDGITLFSQFGQIFPQLNNPAQQLPNDKLDRCTSPNHRDGSRGGPVPTLSNDGNSGKSSSAYASRHQAAEQRRRTRINERLDLLRKMVPHTDRANTASFLEEVLKYIDVLKTRVAELEATLVAIKTGKTAMLPPNDVRLNLSSSGGSLKGDMHGLSHEHAGLLPQSNQQLNTGYSLQQLQQQQIQQQQLLQQQQIQHHEAALAALREEQQQQAAAILAAQQLKQQQELAAARQSCQMADLAAQLGLKTVQGLGQGSQSGMKSDSNLNSNPNMDALSMLAKQASKDAGHRMGMHGHATAAPSPLGQQSGGLYLPPVQQLQVAGGGGDHHSNHSNHPNHSNHSNSVLALLPSGSAASGAATAGQPSSQKARAAAAAAAATATSPASSEDSGMPLKKRKVLML